MSGRASMSPAWYRPALCLLIALFGTACVETSLNPAAPPTGQVVGEVTAADGSRTPQVTLSLSNSTVSFSTETDAGGVYQFPGIPTGSWGLTLAPLPSNWRLAPGQEEARLILVSSNSVRRENFVLERVP